MIKTTNVISSSALHLAVVVSLAEPLHIGALVSGSPLSCLALILTRLTSEESPDTG